MAKKKRERRCFMMLVLKADDLDPEQISSVLNTRSTRAFRRGDLFAADMKSRRSFGMWQLSTAGTVASEEILDHCRCLVGWITPLEAQLKEYRASTNVRVSIAFWWEPLDGPLGFTFPAQEMKWLAEVCNEFDFYFG